MSLVSIINNYPKFQLLSPAIKSIIETVAKRENVSFFHVTIIAAGDSMLYRLKKQYFHDNVLTDTISFNFNEPSEAIEGEIYISIDRIKDNARRFDNTFQQELILVILHSILHLIGYNDKHPDEKLQMERLQQRYLHQIHVKRLFRVLKNNTIMSDNSTLCNEFAKLIEIVRTLRGPSGCEWDRAQTSTSLSPYFLEEAHETIEAINENNHQKLKEELGDLLLHIVFQSEIAEENKQFRLSDSIRNINEKLVRRHPHVFGDVNVKNV
ncbi:MAG: rRNA maturation RNase YbeY, partial [Candidatus Marinimicrobia bacterium]|nr:rRNA maturation RNase YbeY [Candidatus Neomarinimicrobiota bacterium]